MLVIDIELMSAKPCRRIFSCETSTTSGARNYIVASSWERFWRYYSCIADSQRHHYEIIREGSPCHLYFGALNLAPRIFAVLFHRHAFVFHPSCLKIMVALMCPFAYLSSATCIYVSV